MVLATGPSLTAEDVRATAHLPTLAINDAWELAPHARWLYACDLRWWDARWQQLGGFAGERWTRDPDAARKYRIRHIESKPYPGLSVDRHTIHEGCNSGYQAINFGFSVLGFRRQILLGFDAKGTIGKTHFFGRHEERGLPDRPDYGDLAREFEKMDAARYGLEVVNCTRDTALTCFKRMSLADALSLPNP